MKKIVLTVIVAISLGSLLAQVNQGFLFEDQKLLAGDGGVGPENRFGDGVAVSGNVAVIGVDRHDENGLFSGAAYIYNLVDGQWIETQKLLASDGAELDRFSDGAVSISGDLLAIGATGSQSVYIFHQVDGQWVEEKKITPPPASESVFFGDAVAISGELLIVGDSGDEENGLSAGAAYAFSRNGGNWDFEKKLLAPDGSAFDFFGVSVGLSGELAVLGAPNDDDQGTSAGAAYVFSRNGGNWDIEKKLVAFDGASVDFFGESVAISGDLVVVGSPDDDNENGDGAGSIYVHVRNGGSWDLEKKLIASDGQEYTKFGSSVSIFGELVAVGAQTDTVRSDDPGSAYIFSRNLGNWNEQAKFVVTDGDKADSFGIWIANSDAWVLVGAMNDDNKLGENAGAVYAYDLVNNIVISSAVITNSFDEPIGKVTSTFPDNQDVTNKTFILERFLDGIWVEIIRETAVINEVPVLEDDSIGVFSFLEEYRYRVSVLNADGTPGPVTPEVLAMLAVDLDGNQVVDEADLTLYIADPFDLDCDGNVNTVLDLQTFYSWLSGTK